MEKTFLGFDWLLPIVRHRTPSPALALSVDSAYFIQLRFLFLDILGFFFFQGRLHVSYTPNPKIPYATEDALELLILLHLPPKFWG